jgi:prepilin-type N-terminal cleavage/methylation domain-containing protein
LNGFDTFQFSIREALFFLSLCGKLERQAEGNKMSQKETEIFYGSFGWDGKRMGKKANRMHAQIIGQRGFSLIEILFALAIASIAILLTSRALLDAQGTQSESESSYWVAARRAEMQTIVKSANGWNDILANNPDMSCLSASTGCAAFSSPQPLKFPIDSIILDGGSSATGMDRSGNFCTSFDAVNGNGSCTTGIDLKWQALCANPGCVYPQPKLTIQFAKKLPGQAVQNLTSQQLILFRDPKLQSISEVCAAMGGVLMGMSCTLPQLTSSCNSAAGQFVLGFDNVGNVICGKPAPGGCAASDVVTGFNANGGVVCSPACIATTSPSSAATTTTTLLPPMATTTTSPSATTTTTSTTATTLPSSTTTTAATLVWVFNGMTLPFNPSLAFTNGPDPSCSYNATNNTGSVPAPGTPCTVLYALCSYNSSWVGGYIGTGGAPFASLQFEGCEPPP